MEKAGLIGLVKLRYIESDDELSMRGDTLAMAIAKDRENGLIPFFVSCFFPLHSKSHSIQFNILIDFNVI